MLKSDVNITSTRKYVSIFPATPKFVHIIIKKEINALLFSYFFYVMQTTYCINSLLRMEAQTWKRLLNTQNTIPSNTKIEKFVLSE